MPLHHAAAHHAAPHAAHARGRDAGLGQRAAQVDLRRVQLGVDFAHLLGQRLDFPIIAALRVELGVQFGLFGVQLLLQRGQRGVVVGVDLLRGGLLFGGKE